MPNDTYFNDFGSEQIVFSVWLTFACISGLLCNIRTLYKEYQQIKSQPLIPLRVLILIVFLTDFIWMFSHSIIYFMQTVEKRMLTGFGCYFIPISGVWLASGSCVTMAYIAYERYRLIVCEKMVTMKHMIFWMTIIWSLAFIMGCMPAFYKEEKDFGIEVTSTGAFCMHMWYDSRPLGRAHGILSILSCSFSILFIAYFYHRVYKKYREVTGNILVVRTNVKEEEKEVVHKLVMIVYLFIACWLLYLFVMLIQVIVGHPLNSIYEGIATILVYLNPTFNALYYSYPSAKKEDKKPNPSPISIAGSTKSASQSGIIFVNASRPVNMPISPIHKKRKSI